jgi:hypothetical protein
VIEGEFRNQLRFEKSGHGQIFEPPLKFGIAYAFVAEKGRLTVGAGNGVPVGGRLCRAIDGRYGWDLFLFLADNSH